MLCNYVSDESVLHAGTGSRELLCFSRPRIPHQYDSFSGPPVDWASFGISYGPDSIPTTYSQPPSHAGIDYSFGQPGLSSSSSGDVSDLEEFPPFTSSISGQGNELQNVAVGYMSDAYQYRISSSSFIGIPQAEMLTRFVYAHIHATYTTLFSELKCLSRSSCISLPVWNVFGGIFQGVRAADTYFSPTRYSYRRNLERTCSPCFSLLSGYIATSFLAII